ncbi:hypothetical protein [Salinicola avicenniae]|uniref:hypothetical protein n=1 Tax=Salinicola avicenniae TaxID=2916836 RepID=UPI0020738CF0|nr:MULTISPECIES: hypothetical protein [unclassified Salinicola]
MTTQRDFDYQALWNTALSGARSRHGLADTAPDQSDEREPAALTDAFGYFLLMSYAEALRQAYATPWLTLEGLDSARWKAMEKYRLHPHQARSMVEQDLEWALFAELREFALPDQALKACRPALEAAGLTSLLIPAAPASAGDRDRQ